MGILQKLGRELFATGPAGNHGVAAVRVAVSVAVPVLALLAIGHPELTLYAVFGGFTSMYGRCEPHFWRVVHQLEASVLLLSAVLIGTLLSEAHAPVGTLVLVEACFAYVGSMAADAAKLNPVGPFWALFALGASASVAQPQPLWIPLLIGGAASAVSIILSLAVWRFLPDASPDMRRIRIESPWRSSRIRRHALRYFLAVGIAGAAGLASGWGHPYWAMASAAVLLAAGSPRARLIRGVHRMLGTLVGIGLTALILWPQPPLMVLVLLIPVLQFPSELFMRHHFGTAQAFFTPVVLLVTLLASPAADPARVLMDRALETLLGAAIGMAVAVLLRDRKPGGRPAVVAA
ncbi:MULTISPECIES: FUSC family protein [Arthrobacter]|uniref:FUSC family protein n=2 Tax=Arthrobacter TaxID=1663 RepID=A0ABU9KKT8_9MICC|nr:FUSC family protein [Arthrobacter sp. YJM1]MDP5227411.1 FUSC family protein [Arthrobacter sp. YJM1]